MTTIQLLDSLDDAKRDIRKKLIGRMSLFELDEVTKPIDDLIERVLDGLCAEVPYESYEAWKANQ